MKSTEHIKTALISNKISRFADEGFADLEALVENELDVDFSLVSKKISSIEEFDSELYKPFVNGDTLTFYRGERVNDRKRPMIPTIFRNREALFSENAGVVDINADFVYDYYSRLGSYMELYKKIYGSNGRESMYELCAFSQHYIDVSPFVDFTKSLYVAMSFALKGKKEFNDDVVLYTVKIIDSDDYTTDLTTANDWLERYSVLVFRKSENILKDVIASKKLLPMLQEIKNELAVADMMKKGASPNAKLIGIPTNDLMKFQQGVFLLLSDFTLSFNSYPTKNIRDNFEVTKWIICKEVCPYISHIITKDAPWYTYKNLYDVGKAFRAASAL